MNTSRDDKLLLTDGLVQEVWEGEQPEGVASGGCVKDDVLEVGVLGALQKLYHFADGDCFVNAGGQSIQQLACAQA